MKIRLLLALAGLAIGFAAPILAQEKNTGFGQSGTMWAYDIARRTRGSVD